MVKCEFCAWYIDGKCTNPKGIYYNRQIKDSFKDVRCNGYIEIATAGLLSLGEI